MAAVSVPATATPAATVSWAGTVAASAETAKSATMTTKEVILFVKEASKTLNSSGGGSGNKPNPSKTEKSAEGGTSNGWKLGDDIYKKTAKGNDSSWSTVRQRFWKNEATNSNAAEV